MHRLVVGAIALGALSVGTLAAPTDAAGRFRVVKFTDATVASPPVFTGSPSCDAAGNCVVSYANSVEATGDLYGTTPENGIAYTTAGSSTVQITVMGVFTGTLQGCGSGSFAIYVPLTTVGSAPVTAPDMLVPGSGTGALAGMSQVGPWTFTYDPSTRTGSGSGRVRCQVG
jgi:hypothetical protein